MAPSDGQPGKLPKRILAAIVIAAIVLGGAMLLRRIGADPSTVSSRPTFKVARGPLTISVTVAGTIQAREQVIVKSEVQGQTTIIYLVPEGTHVKIGDLLVELDDSKLQDEHVDQLIRVQNSEAAFIRSRENLAVDKNQAVSDIAQATLDSKFSKEDLTKYQDGEYPKERDEAQARITLAEEEVKQAKERFGWSQKLHNERYISQTELDKDRLAWERTELDLKLTKANLELLEKYTKGRQIAELTSDVEQAQMALVRVGRKAKANIVQAEADLRAKQSEYERQKDKLAKIENQITKCKMYASAETMVIYATTGKGNWRGNAEPLDEGQQVRERQELIYLPTARSMKAEVKVHESNLKKVAIDQPVRVTVDALPGRVFSGRVTKISPLPDAQSVWLNPDLKVYSTEIHLDGEADDVRTGMTCRTEIIVDHYPDTVYVPVQAVVRVGTQPTVYVQSGRIEQSRPVEIGLDNNQMVRIIGGLEPGEQVSLVPPLAAASVGIDASERRALAAKGKMAGQRSTRPGDQGTGAQP